MLFARLDPKEVSKKVEVIEAKQKASIKAVKEKKEKENLDDDFIEKAIEIGLEVL